MLLRFSAPLLQVGFEQFRPSHNLAQSTDGVIYSVLASLDAPQEGVYPGSFYGGSPELCDALHLESLAQSFQLGRQTIDHFPGPGFNLADTKRSFLRKSRLVLRSRRRHTHLKLRNVHTEN